MTEAILEHANITVTDADKTAENLCNLFGWHVRWAGEVLGGIGRSVHVGTENHYLALYAPKKPVKGNIDHYDKALSGTLNHIGLVVDDLDAMEKRVKAAGYSTHMHSDYEPGRRFYFDFDDGIEIELVSYDVKQA